MVVNLPSGSMQDSVAPAADGIIIHVPFLVLSLHSSCSPSIMSLRASIRRTMSARDMLAETDLAQVSLTRQRPRAARSKNSS